MAIKPFIVDLLECILIHIVFLFDGDTYLQVQGVVMETCCAPAYTNLCLGGWERDLFSGEAPSMYLCQLLSWHRYIGCPILDKENIVKQLQDFIAFLNRNCYYLIFTYSFDQEIISFLALRFTTKDGPLTSYLCREHHSPF